MQHSFKYARNLRVTMAALAFALGLSIGSSCTNPEKSSADQAGTSVTVVKDSSTPVATAGKSADSLAFLATLDGKYPRDVKLLEHQAFVNRLITLIGKENFNFLRDTWATETPIISNTAEFVASGCKAHDCGDTNFIIVYDFTGKALYCGIRNAGKVTVIGDNHTYPASIITWKGGGK